MTDCVQLPIRTVVEGRTWHLYAYEYLHALSMEHAAAAAAALIGDMGAGAGPAGRIVSAEGGQHG